MITLAHPLPGASPGTLLNTPVLQIDALHVAVGEGRDARQVLDGLQWSVEAGQLVGLLGRNGAGKTTLMESLLGLRETQAGSVCLFGRPLAAMNDALRARIGYVPQHSELFEWLTARQLLAYFRSFYPRWNTAKAEGLMSRWAIPADTAIGRLSGGEQQRLSIVRALAPEPELLVLDEPVASLDPAGRRDFLRELVDQVIGRGTTVVFSTHILSDLERVAFNVAFLAAGRIVLQAPLDSLLEHTRRVVLPGPRNGPPPGWQALRRTALDGGREQWLARKLDDAPIPAAAGGSGGDWGAGARLEPLSFEDLFLELTQ